MGLGRVKSCSIQALYQKENPKKTKKKKNPPHTHEISHMHNVSREVPEIQTRGQHYEV